MTFSLIRPVYPMLAGALMAGAVLFSGPAFAQGNTTTQNTRCPNSVGCAAGVPPAAAGGESGSGPAAIRNSQSDSPVGTGAGGGSSGAGGSSGGGAKGSSAAN